MKRLLTAVCGVALLAVSSIASAHTIAVGTFNAGVPGSVTVWLGSYHTSAAFEGSMTLLGDTQAFNTFSVTQPVGLTLGTNLFYAIGTSGAGATGQFDQPTDTVAGLPIISWQGVTFAGITAGDHAYSITGMNSANWSDWNSSTPNWTGTLNIPTSSVGDPTVPEPGTLALLALGLAGIGFRKRIAR
ncbi:MAG: PEP-CTERM sorting domain-containing protein [Motiliproteus sp.]